MDAAALLATFVHPNHMLMGINLPVVSLQRQFVKTLEWIQNEKPSFAETRLGSGYYLNTKLLEETERIHIVADQ